MGDTPEQRKCHRFIIAPTLGELGVCLDRALADGWRPLPVNPTRCLRTGRPYEEQAGLNAWWAHPVGRLPGRVAIEAEQAPAEADHPEVADDLLPLPDPPVHHSDIATKLSKELARDGKAEATSHEPTRPEDTAAAYAFRLFEIAETVFTPHPKRPEPLPSHRAHILRLALSEDRKAIELESSYRSGRYTVRQLWRNPSEGPPEASAGESKHDREARRILGDSEGRGLSNAISQLADAAAERDEPEDEPKPEDRHSEL